MKLIIVMASYNGARFIEDQIKSIQNQSVKDWSLFIRDDGSQDGTLDIIKGLANSDHRLTLLQDDCGNLGVVQNFARLMQAAYEAGADYVALSDQDDIWRANKLELQLEKIGIIENANGQNKPALIHSDLEVVNDRMNPIASSFMAYARISPEPLKIEQLICQNVVTGCSCLINRAMLKLALPVPQGVPMHDWWLTLLALALGEVGFIPSPLVRYRQHGGNFVGANPSAPELLKRLLSPVSWKQQVARVAASILQAGQILNRIQKSRSLGDEDARLVVIRDYARLNCMPRLKRLGIMRAHRIRKRSMLSDVLFKAILLLRSRDLGCK